MMMNEVELIGASLTDAVLVEAILSRTIFTDINITGADFTHTILDQAQVKELYQKASSANPQTGVATRESLGCQ